MSEDERPLVAISSRQWQVVKLKVGAVENERLLSRSIRLSIEPHVGKKALVFEACILTRSVCACFVRFGVRGVRWCPPEYDRNVVFNWVGFKVVGWQGFLVFRVLFVFYLEFLLH